MDFKRFEHIINLLNEEHNRVKVLYDNGLDLINFNDLYHTIINELLIDKYSEEGSDWIGWFCYDNGFGTKGLNASDAKGNPICYDIKSLWEHLEEYYNIK